MCAKKCQGGAIEPGSMRIAKRKCKSRTETGLDRMKEHGKGKGKGSLYEIEQQLKNAANSKEDEFMEKEHAINDRFARKNSHVVYFKDTCYKVAGSATFKGGHSWRCGNAKYHISPEEKDPDTGEYYIFMMVGNNPVKVEGETVEWPEFDEDIYEETMRGRERISHEKWKCKERSDQLTLMMKGDLHHLRSMKTRKRKAETYQGQSLGKKGKFQP